MLILNKNLLLFNKKFIWFPHNLHESLYSNDLIYIRQHSLSLKKKYIIYEEDFKTTIINLNQVNDQIFNKFKASTRYDIRKSNSIGLFFQKINLLDKNELNFFKIEVKKFYKIKKLNNNFDFKYLPLDKLFLVKVHDKNIWFTYGLFIYDENRFRLLLFINNYSKIDKKLLGYSSKFLIWESLQYAKLQNFKFFDFGGLSYDDNLKGINKFKLSFGGETIYEKNTLYCRSYLIRIVYYLRNLFK